MKLTTEKKNVLLFALDKMKEWYNERDLPLKEEVMHKFMTKIEDLRNEIEGEVVDETNNN